MTFHGCTWILQAPRSPSVTISRMSLLVEPAYPSEQFCSFCVATGKTPLGSGPDNGLLCYTQHLWHVLFESNLQALSTMSPLAAMFVRRSFSMIVIVLAF